MGKPVFFANLVGIRRSYIRGPKSFAHEREEPATRDFSVTAASVKLGPGTGGRGREAALTSQSQKLTTSVIRPWLMVLYVHKNLVWFIRDERPQKLSDKVSGTDGKLT